MLAGSANREGTARLRSRFPELDGAGFYRQAHDWCLSSLGFGTYLGAPDDATDLGYAKAAIAAVQGGINVLDTAINYRHQRSERAIAQALERLMAAGFCRDEIVVCTKAGFLTPGAVPADLRPEEMAGGMHSMAPRFLADQLERSRANLKLQTIDVFYLHNPETQLNFIPREEFERRVAAAFEFLEGAASDGRIRYYGTATWHGYRQPAGALDGLSLARLEALAREAGGNHHHFRFLQLPFNLAMPEAYTRRTQPPCTVLEAARELGMTVVASAALLQARLTRSQPPVLAAAFAAPLTDAQIALQFARSAPGIAVALVGMSNPEHVTENLGLARHAPLSSEQFDRLFRT